MRSRTNIEIDDRLLELVMRRYALRTKTDAVDFALRRLAGEPLTIEMAISMQGAGLIDELPAEAPPVSGHVGTGRA
jgi:Arc/MetJ family transcription regulator